MWSGVNRSEPVGRNENEGVDQLGRERLSLRDKYDKYKLFGILQYFHYIHIVRTPV